METGVSLKRIATRNIVLVNPDRIHQLCHPSSAQLHQDAAFALYLSAPSPSGSVSDSLHSSLNSKTIPYLFFLRKEVIQPHLPIRLPCYDFTPVTGPTFDSSFLSVRSLASGVTNSHGVTGGVYKTRERIHRDMLIHDY